MSKHVVTYVGHPDEAERRTGPAMTTFRGIDFWIGKPVQLEVETDSGQAMITKLRGNRFFSVEDVSDGAEPQADPAPADTKPRKVR